MTDVYYADLFIINNCGCLVMGHGKSRVCRDYTGENTVEIGCDSIRLENNNNKLFGYSDVGMGLFKFDKETSANCQIKYLIRMLNEEETNRLECNNIKIINKDEYINLCKFNITFNAENQSERIKEFKVLINNADLTCIIVPWCSTIEEKGRMLKDFI